MLLRLLRSTGMTVLNRAKRVSTATWIALAALLVAVAGALPGLVGVTGWSLLERHSQVTAIRPYFDKLASREPEQMLAARDFASVASPADRYAANLGALVEAYRDNYPSKRTDSQSVDWDGDTSVTLCAQAECVVFSEFKIDGPTRKLLNFLVDGRPVESRLTPRLGVAQVDGLTVEVAGALAPTGQSSRVEFALKVKNRGGDGKVDLFTSQYLGPDGEYHFSTGNQLQYKRVPAWAQSWIYLEFDDAKMGGTIGLMFKRPGADYFMTWNET